MSNVHPPGMCRDCRVEPAPLREDGTHTTRCEACRRARNQRVREERAARRAKGRCLWLGCSKQAKKGRRYCAEHLEYYRVREERRRRLDGSP